MTQWTDIETFIIKRWPDAVDFRDIVEATEDKLEDTFRKIGTRVAGWLTAKGFDLWVDTGAAEFSAYHPSWVQDEDQGALVYLSVGGLYPPGYRKADSDNPYVGVYTKDLKTLGLKGPAREAFGEDLRSRWGNLLDGWKNEPDDREYPLLEYVVVPSEQRVLLMTDPDTLHEFAISQFSRLLPFSDGIDKCLSALKNAPR